MYSKNSTKLFTEESSRKIRELDNAFRQADAVLVGAGAGLSAAAGLGYSGRRFEKTFADFQAKYGIRDMYEGGFYPFETPNAYWAWWSRHILVNRYEPEPTPLYDTLFQLLKDKDYFILTTNADHQFQRHGFSKERLFYTQGDYGLWQCAKACHCATYDNEAKVRKMAAEQRDMQIPSHLIPHCPKCGAPMAMNLRCDDRFVQDEGWYAAQNRYNAYIRSHKGVHILFLELGVGMNTPGIIKLPFWQMAYEGEHAFYASVSLDAAYCPKELSGKSVCIADDLAAVLDKLTISFALDDN